MVGLMDLTAIYRFAKANYGLVTRAELLQAGFTDHMIQRRLASGEWRLIHPGVYQIDASALSWHARLRAATMAAGPEALVSHRTALQLWSLEGLNVAPIELTIPFGRLPVPRGVIVHRTRRGMSASVVAGIPATSADRAILDSARYLPTPMLEQVYDSGVRQRIVTPTSMAKCLNEFAVPGVRGRKKVIAMLDDRKDGNPLGSPAETSVLRLLREAGVEEPHRQYVIVVGGRLIILDLAWPPLKAVEIDGLTTHASAAALAYDLDRQNLILGAGWQLRRFPARTIRQNPRLVVAEIKAFLAA